MGMEMNMGDVFKQIVEELKMIVKCDEEKRNALNYIVFVNDLINLLKKLDFELKKLEGICRDKWDRIEIARRKLVDRFNEVLEEEDLQGEDAVALALYLLMNVVGVYILANKDHIVNCYSLLVEAEQ